MRPLARLIATVTVSSCLVLALVASAHGHAIIIHSEPADGEHGSAPHRLLLHFNSRIEKTLCSVVLVGPARGHIVVLHQAPGGTPDTLTYPIPALSPGAYQARWKVLSSDGHLTEGRVSFSVNSK
jgi:copper resistance protein C